MPDVNVTAVKPVMAGVAAPWVVPVISEVYYFVNNGNATLEVENTSGGPVNVTITRYGTVDGDAISARVIACPDSAVTAIGPFPVGYYNKKADPNSGKANFTFASVTGIKYRLTALS